MAGKMETALAAVLGVVAISLQGCGVSEQITSVALDMMPMDCPERTFIINDTFIGRIKATTDGKSGVVKCPPGFIYDGPPVQCNWVNKVCIVDGDEDVTEDSCFKDFAFTSPGLGLKDWPASREPAHYRSDQVSWHLQARKQLAIAKRRAIYAKEQLEIKAGELKESTKGMRCTIQAKMHPDQPLGPECQPNATTPAGEGGRNLRSRDPGAPGKRVEPAVRRLAKGDIELPKRIDSDLLTCNTKVGNMKLAMEEEMAEERGMVANGTLQGFAAGVVVTLVLCFCLWVNRSCCPSSEQRYHRGGPPRRIGRGMPAE